MAQLSDEQRQVFLDPNYGVVATIRADGSPRLTTVWVDADGDDVLFNTTPTRRKYFDLRRDARASLLVYAGRVFYKWVSVHGRVDLTEEGAIDHIHKLSHKYRGRDYNLRPGDRRVIARLRPERVNAYNV